MKKAKSKRCRTKLKTQDKKQKGDREKAMDKSGMYQKNHYKFSLKDKRTKSNRQKVKDKWQNANHKRQT